jgi:hypothetical protein
MCDSVNAVGWMVAGALVQSAAGDVYTWAKVQFWRALKGLRRSFHASSGPDPQRTVEGAPMTTTENGQAGDVVGWWTISQPEPLKPMRRAREMEPAATDGMPPWACRGDGQSHH